MVFGVKSPIVTELAAPFEMSLPAISKHLRILETAELVQREKLGRVKKSSVRGRTRKN